ncbi:MAG: class I SAM-dependent methyltransferase [Desulfuromonas sp.]|nr:MAG: class I SAM-dependent methyltransferase [Desulfuromonas sp.]
MIDINTVDQSQLFDRFAVDYDQLLSDWDSELVEQGRILDNLIRIHSSSQVHTVLDCTCGIGTQCIGLAKLGYQVTGTDISSKSVERSRHESSRFGVDVQFAVADLRELESIVQEKFDCVISCDNSLPALLTAEDVKAGLKQMYLRLKPGGISIISIRNYESLFKEKKSFHPRQIHRTPNGRRVVFDLWEYPSDEIVVFNVFFLEEGPTGWEVVTREMVYRAIFSEDLVAMLKEAGFKDVEIVRDLNSNKLPFDFYISRR